MPLSEKNQFHIQQHAAVFIARLEEGEAVHVYAFLERGMRTGWDFRIATAGEASAIPELIAALQDPKSAYAFLADADIDEARYIFVQAAHKALATKEGDAALSEEQMETLETGIKERFGELPEEVRTNTRLEAAAATVHHGIQRHFFDSGASNCLSNLYRTVGLALCSLAILFYYLPEEHRPSNEKIMTFFKNARTYLIRAPMLLLLFGIIAKELTRHCKDARGERRRVAEPPASPADSEAAAEEDNEVPVSIRRRGPGYAASAGDR